MEERSWRGTQWISCSQIAEGSLLSSVCIFAYSHIIRSWKVVTVLALVLLAFLGLGRVGLGVILMWKLRGVTFRNGIWVCPVQLLTHFPMAGEFEGVDWEFPLFPEKDCSYGG